jgi:hypothetical protein
MFVGWALGFVTFVGWALGAGTQGPLPLRKGS